MNELEKAKGNAGRLAQRLRRMLGLAPKFNPMAPFGTQIRASRETYKQIYADALARSYPEMDAFLAQFSHQIDSTWMNGLALHTQVVVKQSPINFQHGRMLYCLLRERMEKLPPDRSVIIFETGTARGFSAICMSRALGDARRNGFVVTSDIIPHDVQMLWNCIDDHDGPCTRNALLQNWQIERDRIAFISGPTEQTMRRLGLGRIHFAFIDGAHHEDDVLKEYRYVAERQRPGDVIVFDDVTPAKFDGIVRAVDAIERDGLYEVFRLNADDDRSYAVATRLDHK